MPTFGKLLLSAIEPGHISAFQRKRLQAGAAPSEINKECAVLRMIIRKHRFWHLLAPDFRPLRESEEQGRAVTPDEMDRLLKAARTSRSQSLYPALVLLVSTGLRVSELRKLQWRQIDLLERDLVVGKSKTKGGEGRRVPLNQDAFGALTEWRQNFPNPLPNHFVFPSERYGLNGDEGFKYGMVAIWNRNPEKPIGSWKTAWGVCRTNAQVQCRLHDLRHTFVSRLAEGQTSDQTIMALSGHLSRTMMDRYSHVRNEAKRRAVEGLNSVKAERESPQYPPQ
jgi:integrase